MIAGSAIFGGRVVAGVVAREVVRSEARMRKRAVFWRVGREREALRLGMRFCSQVALGISPLLVKNAESWLLIADKDVAIAML